ncbi:MAG: ChbG/HpnK family deacetylase, partial [Desulfobacterales bacterium]|nr:ChbG/HpnK family deacetylase [Desulfobacterales bacterium]
MLIITADDFGINSHTTDKILFCYKKNRITASSAMMFMADSERAASLALDVSLRVGLHLNFTQPFSGVVKLKKLQEYHNQII